MLYFGRGGALIYASNKFIGIDFGEQTRREQYASLDPLKISLGVPRGGVGIMARAATKGAQMTTGWLEWNSTKLSKNHIYYAFFLPKDTYDAREIIHAQLQNMSLLPPKDFITAWSPYGFGIACPLHYQHLIDTFCDAVASGDVAVHVSDKTPWQQQRLKVYISDLIPERTVQEWSRIDFIKKQQQNLAAFA